MRRLNVGGFRFSLPSEKTWDGTWTIVVYSIPEEQRCLRDALRNSLIPVITLIGVEMGYLLGGAFIVEQIFALPGIGRLTVNAISQREYALVQGVTLFIALNFVIINLVVDLLYAAIDPRISYDR